MPTTKTSTAKSGATKKNAPGAKSRITAVSNSPKDSALHKALLENFGFDSFKGNQEAIIKSLLAAGTLS
jgi:ATP-dependent DNA helicase RecQ